MNRWIDIAIFLLVIALPVVTTGLLVTGHLELWIYLFIHGILLWRLQLFKKLERWR